MCGILGIQSNQKVILELIDGLMALQHRGQDSAGLVTFDKVFHVKKAKGLVHDLFPDSSSCHFLGNQGLGHIRYTTQGTTELNDAQPFTVIYPFGLAMVHNGNVINFEELKESLVRDHHRLILTSNDAELLLYTFALELQKQNLRQLSIDDLFQTVSEVQQIVHGAYATLTLIANKGMLAFMDPHGIRPLVLGKKEMKEGISYAFSSETKSLDYLGFDVIHNLTAGEAIFIDNDMNVHSRVCHRENRAFCVFEYIYFAQEDSVIHNRLVAGEREKLGRTLAKYFRKKNLLPDIIIDVPSSAYFFAQGLSDELHVPYKRGLVKNNYVKRSFISPTQQLRERIVLHKLNPIRSIIKGKKVAVVDDSIVRGTTSRRIVHLLRKAGASEVYFVSGSPPVKNPCVYGINMSQRKEMIAANYSIDQIRSFIGADALIYPTIEDMRSIDKGLGLCDACFSGEYPTPVSDDIRIGNPMESGAFFIGEGRRP